MANSASSNELHSITKHNNTSISGPAANEILKFDGTNWVNSISPDTSATVTWNSHGFHLTNDIGKAVKSTGTNGQYEFARANTAANAEVVGVITAVPDINTLVIATSGWVRVAAAVPNVTAGTALFLHPDAGSDLGTLTATEPTTAGQISKPVAIVTTANSEMVLLSYRGEVIGSAAATIADNSITLAKMAGGTDGQIITYDANGDPVAVGPGTDGQVLTSTGPGSPPAFEAIAAGANVKVGSFTRDSSASVGTQVVSGIGFTPKSVIFFTVQDGTHEMSVGMDDCTEARVVYHDHPTSANTFALADTSGSGMKSIRTIHASGGNTFNGKITALASGQFTVTWDKVGSPTGTLTVMYMAFG